MTSARLASRSSPETYNPTLDCFIAWAGTNSGKYEYASWDCIGVQFLDACGLDLHYYPALLTSEAREAIFSKLPWTFEAALWRAKEWKWLSTHQL